MKIILSRKGFDSSNGGIASPIMPDGEMLSFPIPSSDSDFYSDYTYGEYDLSILLSQLKSGNSLTNCHMDPDIRNNIRKKPLPDWKPAFGQESSSSSYLLDIVSEGDIFLFFGWFHKTDFSNGKFSFSKKSTANTDYFSYSDMHAIWGYLQIGKIITDPQEIRDYYWHPHSKEPHLSTHNNALFLPTENLSFDSRKPGYGTLRFREDRILTMQGHSKADWVPRSFMMPENTYSNRHNSSTKGGLYYKGIWQELVLKESDEANEWMKNMLAD